jgi:hypothetical protein
MIGPEPQKAIYAALKAAVVCGGRIYDQVPAKPKFPYVTLGDEQVLDDSNSCGDGWELFADVHLWDRPENGSKAEMKTQGSAIRVAVLSGLVIPGFVLDAITLESSRSLRDPDGKTEHGVLTFKLLLSPA